MAELQARMGQSEFMEWLEFYELEPFGEVRAELRAGMVASIIANVHRDAKKAPEPYKPRQFMADFEIGEAAAQAAPDAATLLEKVRALNTVFGGVDLRKQ